MTSVFHPEARDEFRAAVEYYNEAETGLGVDFAGEVEAAVGLIEAFPNSWTEVAFGIRRCLVRRYPFALLYGIECDMVVIYAVMHTRRDPDYWKSRLDLA